MSDPGISMIVGVVLVPILQWLKRALNFSGPVMLWFTLFVSFLASAAVCLLTGKVTAEQLLTQPTVWLGSSGVVFSTAMLVYGSIKERMNLGGKS